jgi:hypothetical protein
LLDNVCKKNRFTSDKVNLCETISEGTMTVGLSKALNYLANQLIDLQDIPNNSSLSLVNKFNDLILL